MSHEGVPSLPLLTFGVLGAQCVWAIETAFGAPFLLHLGLPKAQMAVVFIAGPLSGLIVQPCIGLISDASTSKWGRRRPLLIASCLVCVPSIVILGCARPLASIFTSEPGLQTQWTLAIAIFAIFLIDFSVNAVQALDRALILDLVPTHLQALANAWSARLSGLGAIVGFSVSQTDLTLAAPFRWFPFLTSGDATEAQVRCVCVFLALLLALTQAVTISVAKETPATKRVDAPQVLSSLVEGIKQMLIELTDTAKSLSRPMIHLFRVQLFLQSAFYPIIFYSTTWIAQIATAQTMMDNAAAIRLGSKAFLLHAVLSISCTLLLPMLLKEYVKRHPDRKRDSLALLLSIATFFLALTLISTRLISASGSVTAGMVCVAVGGFPWALNIWAPSALIGIMIRKEAEMQRDMLLPTMITRSGSAAETGIPASSGDVSGVRRTGTNEEAHALMRHRDANDEEDADEAEEEGLRDEMRMADPYDGRTGSSIGGEPSRGATILGLFNVSIVLPQFLMTLISTILFSFMEDGEARQSGAGAEMEDVDVGSNDAIELVFQIGAVSALIAAVLILRMSKEHFHALSG